MAVNEMGDPGQGLAAWGSFVRLPEFAVEAATTALLVIDLTYQQASRHHGVCRQIREAGLGDDLEYFMSRIENVVVPNAGRLIDAFRRAGSVVVYTRCASIVGDGSDQTWRHRAFGLVCAEDSKDAQILEEIAPQPGDILLSKTGSSVFNSTNVEHLLRNMGVTTLVMSGIFTNSCVEGATRDAGDRDFRVLLAEDACAAMSPSGHRNALAYLDANFCHVKSTDHVIELLTGRVAEVAR
jgi:nicotinamidase-related amidase